VHIRKSGDWLGMAAVWRKKERGGGWWWLNGDGSGIGVGESSKSLRQRCWSIEREVAATEHQRKNTKNEPRSSVSSMCEKD
jgi:hypothetical protein